MTQHQGRHFLQYSRPEPDSGSRAPRHGHADHRSSQRAICRTRQDGIRRLPENLPDPGPGHHLSVVGHRRLGSRDRQYAVAGRQGADGGDRPFRHDVAADGGALGHRCRFDPGRLAPRRRSRGDRSQARPGYGACHQGRDGGAQRDVDRRHQPDRRHPRRDGQGRASRAAAGGYHLLARLGRLPARRMEGRRHRQLFAKGIHAAAGTRLQCHLGKGPRGCEDQQDAAVVLGLGRNAQAQRGRLLSLYAGHQPALRLARSHRDAAGGGAGRGIRPAQAPCRRHPRRGRRIGASRCCVSIRPNIRRC